MISLFTMLFMLGVPVLLIILGRLFRYPVRNIFDVIELARPTSDAEFEPLLDPEYEARLRSCVSREEFRAEQRIRIHKFFDCMRHRSFNALLITRFAYLEWRRWAKEPKTEEKLCPAFPASRSSSGYYGASGLFAFCDPDTGLLDLISG